jgi:gamma-glutamyltranspeptidase/glutathione hydrolase
MKDGKPFMSFAVQGGDTQDQNLLQCFLNVVEFGMTIQQSVKQQTLIVTNCGYHLVVQKQVIESHIPVKYSLVDPLPKR